MWAEILTAILVLGLNVILAFRCLNLSTDTKFCDSVSKFFGGKHKVGRREANMAALIMIPFGAILAVLVFLFSIAFYVLWGLYYIVFVKCLKGVCTLFKDEQVASLLEISFADLKRDNKEMKREGRNFWHIKAVLVWRATTTFVPIAWDCLLRIVKATVPFSEHFKG